MRTGLGCEHAGLIVVWSVRNSKFHEIVDGVRLLTAARPRQRDRKNLVLTLRARRDAHQPHSTTVSGTHTHPVRRHRRCST